MIKNSFWQKLPKPFFVLAPMADVTDVAFRKIIAKYGKPDVSWTEFVSADGLMRAPEEGKKKLLKDLEFSEEERPIVAQLFSSKPEYMEGAARLCMELGFDGIDINMGCPDKGIEKQGCGAAMIKNPKVAKEVIRAAKRGAPNLPISVKTRVGFNKVEIDTWIPEILSEGVAVLTIHARTRKEMSKVPANWNYVKQVVALRDALAPETLIIGNGDVKNVAEGLERVKETGCDGVMIGRGIFGFPWRFADVARVRHDYHIEHPVPILKDVSKYEDNNISMYQFENGAQSRNSAERSECAPDNESEKIGTGVTIPTTKEKLEVMLEHTKLFEKLLGDTKNFALMKKHYKAYVEGFPGAKELREKLMETKDASGVESIVKEFLKSL